VVFQFQSVLKLSDGRVKIQRNSFARVSNFLGFSPLMLIWPLIVLELSLICRKCSQKWKKKHFDSRGVENNSDKKIQRWVLFKQYRQMREPQT